MSVYQGKCFRKLKYDNRLVPEKFKIVIEVPSQIKRAFGEKNEKDRNIKINI